MPFQSRSEPLKILLIEFNPFQPAHTPISLGYLAACLKKHGFSAEILNVGSDTRLSVEGMRRFLLHRRPGIIGLSAYQRNMFFLSGLADLCKSVLPASHIVIGGPQATFLPNEALAELPSMDLICRSEGEVALLSLANRVREGRSLRDLEGWSGRNPDGTFWSGSRLDGASDLDEYPSPYLDGSLDPGRSEEAILLGSRGCPYRCAFCYTPRAFGKKVRFHSVERVLEEMRWISRQGVERFWFADPSFTFREDRVHGFLERILSSGLRAQIWLETRVDLVCAEILGKMKRAGVHTIAYGLESAAEVVLKEIRKPLELALVQRAVRLTQEAGIDVELFSQYGLPGESYEDALRTLSFVQANQVPIRGNTNAQQMQIYFGTDVQGALEEFGIRPFKEILPSYLSTGSRYETCCMTAEEIQNVGRIWKAASLDGGKHIVS